MSLRTALVVIGLVALLATVALGVLFGAYTAAMAVYGLVGGIGGAVLGVVVFSITAIVLGYLAAWIVVIATGAVGVTAGALRRRGIIG